MPISENIEKAGRQKRARVGCRKVWASMCAFCALLVLFICGSPLLSTLRAQAKNSSAPNYGLEGDWLRNDLAGSGDFTGLDAFVPKAQLTPAGKALLAKFNASFIAARGGARAGAGHVAHKAGQAYVLVGQPCQFVPGYVNESMGWGTFHPNSIAFHLIVGKSQVIWTGEGGGAARIIWMNGRKLPNESHWTNPEYVSVGHWENGALVVKTVGLSAIGGAFYIPGAGVREPSTLLTERFRLTPDGKQLKITYTYWDPKYYVKPDTYTYTFDRGIPPYALDDYCDPGNPLSYQSIVPQSQNLK